MKKQSSILAVTALLSLFCAAETEKVIDYVALNGGTPKGLLEDRYKSLESSYSEEERKDVLSRTDNYTISATVGDLEGRTGVLKIVSDLLKSVEGWNGPAFRTTLTTGLVLSDLHKVKVAYHYTGTQLVGQKMRMVVNFGEGVDFNVESTEGIVAGEWATAEFDFGAVFETSSALYEQHRNTALYRTRLYFYDTLMEGTYCAYSKPYIFPAGETFLFGTFTYCPQTGPVRAVFETAGGEPIADIAVNSQGNVTLPLPVRAGYQFIGWSDDTAVHEAETERTLETTTKFYAIWKNLTPETGLEWESSNVRSLDILKANGSTWGLVTDIYRERLVTDKDWHTNSYSGELGAYSFLRMNGDSVKTKPTAVPSVIEGTTYLTLREEASGNGWNGPSLELPVVGVTPADVQTLTVQYLYNNEIMIGDTMTLYFEIDGTWRHVTSADTIIQTPGTEMASVTMDLRAALGDDYRSLRGKPITAWRLYPYTVDDFKEDHGYSKDYPLYKDTQITFGKLLLTGNKRSLTVVIR